jgi:hypothetical protein
VRGKCGSYFGELVVVLDEIENNFDSALVDVAHLLIVALAKDVGSHDSSNVPCVHLVATLFVDSVE